MAEEESAFVQGPPEFSAQSAGSLRVVASRRSMRTYIVTDSELRNITLANAISGVSFSFMTGLWGYAFSMGTELIFMDKPSHDALMWNTVVHPICVYGGCIFGLFGVAMIVWRHFMIDLIKREMSPENRTGKGLLGRLKEAIRPTQ
jgi:hypothetical protein